MRSEPGARARGEQAQEEERLRSKFSGWIGNLFIFDPSGGVEPPGEAKNPGLCSDPVPVGLEELESSPYYIATLGYLPPGTYELEEPNGQRCGGDLAGYSRRLEVLPYSGTITIGRSLVSRAIRFPASRGRIHSDRINGKPAVIIDPLTAEGFGQSGVFIEQENGVVAVMASGLPLDEIMRVAEGLGR